MKNPFAEMIAADVVKFLSERVGPPPPGFREALEEKLAVTMQQGPHGPILVAACVCTKCQDFRVEAFRMSCKIAQDMSMGEVMRRNAQMPSMN